MKLKSSAPFPRIDPAADRFRGRRRSHASSRAAAAAAAVAVAVAVAVVVVDVVAAAAAADDAAAAARAPRRSDADVTKSIAATTDIVWRRRGATVGNGLDGNNIDGGSGRGIAASAPAAVQVAVGVSRVEV